MPRPLLVSVVINNYNYGRYLSAAIESALTQTYSDVETIVVDDGSTDESRGVILQYDTRIRSLLKANGGQASAVNAGFAACHGDIILFLDADDTLLPDIVDRVVEAFRERANAARVQYRLAVTDASGRPTGEYIPPAYVTMASGDLSEAVMRFGNSTWWPPTSGHAYAARALQRILPMPEAPFHTAVDHYLLRTSALCGPIVSLEVVGATYRRHEANDDLRERLDLERVRAHIHLIGAAHPYLKRFADSVGRTEFPSTAEDVADLRYVGLRMISRKLDPGRHPLPGDRVSHLALRGFRIANQQRHQSRRMRWLWAMWFLALFVAPRSMARELAEDFAFPQSRRWLNRFLRVR